MTFPENGPHGRSISRRRVLVAAGCALASAPGVPALAAAAAKGEVVDFPPLLLLDGSRIEPGDWKGHAGVIVFWSTDCAYCKRHNARLEKLYQTMRKRGSDLRIVGLASDTDAQLVRDHLATNGWHFPVALATPEIRSKLTDRRIVPMTILIDRQGRLQLAIPGEMSDDDLQTIGRQLG